MTCRTCLLLKVAPDKSGRIVPRKNKVYRCSAAENPPMPRLPASVTGEYGFRWPPSSRWMGADDGVDCPGWVERTKHSSSSDAKRSGS
jgi:hypothetical protein